IRVIHVTAPYKLVSREFHEQDTLVDISGIKIGSGFFALMAGPCAVESREMILETADRLRAAGVGILRGGAFKPRTSPYSFQGLGEQALRWLAEAREQTQMPVVTEVTSPDKVGLVAEYADILQVGARNMQNFDLLLAIAEQDRPVLLKRGLSATIDEWLMAAEYILSRGVNTRVILCERGIRTFEKNTRNTLDLNALPVLRKLTHLPVIVDPSHGTGVRGYVTPMALAALAGGADGLMVEVHPDPDKALSDGPQSLTLDMLETLLRGARSIAPVVGRSLHRASVTRAPSKAETAGPAIAFQGEPGAFSEQAAQMFLGQDAPTLPCFSFRDVFAAVAEGKARLGMIPVENTITGSIQPNLDLLLEHELFVVGEVKLRVEHLLITLPGVTEENIKTVYAHPQAALQCERFLRTRDWELLVDYDTAASVRRLKQEGREDAAAIAGRDAVRLHGLAVLREGIESSPLNYTRFLAVARKPVEDPAADKTSVVFATRHKPGALARVLQHLADGRINMMRLESRPIPDRPWEYLFYVDLEGSRESPRVSEALDAMEKETLRFRWLGSYPAG
ncbi:MAG: 3-deoxy-7-phosphoheptulonate synthase, partial [Acidobacteriota bacterium]